MGKVVKMAQDAGKLPKRPDAPKTEALSKPTMNFQSSVVNGGNGATAEQMNTTSNSGLAVSEKKKKTGSVKITKTPTGL